MFNKIKTAADLMKALDALPEEEKDRFFSEIVKDEDAQEAAIEEAKTEGETETEADAEESEEPVEEGEPAPDADAEAEAEPEAEPAEDEQGEPDPRFATDEDEAEESEEPDPEAEPEAKEDDRISALESQIKNIADSIAALVTRIDAKEDRHGAGLDARDARRPAYEQDNLESAKNRYWNFNN